MESTLNLQLQRMFDEYPLFSILLSLSEEFAQRAKKYEEDNDPKRAKLLGNIVKTIDREYKHLYGNTR